MGGPIGRHQRYFDFLGRRHISTSGFASTATEMAVFALFWPVQPSNCNQWVCLREGRWRDSSQITAVGFSCYIDKVHRVVIFAIAQFSCRLCFRPELKPNALLLHFLAERRPNIGRAFGTLCVVCLSSVCDVLHCGKTVRPSQKLSQGVNRKPWSKSWFLGRRHISTSGFAGTAPRRPFLPYFCPYSPAIGTRWYKWTF